MNRKSMIATGAALVLLLGGTAGAYYFVDQKKGNEEAESRAETDSLNIFSFDANDVSSIDVTNTDGYFRFTFDQSTDVWIIEDTDYQYKFTPNSYNLNVIASMMSNLKADHKADNKEGDLSKYGLDSPVKIVCHTKGEDYTLLVGSSSVTNEFRYVKLPDDDTIYCIDHVTGDDLSGDLSLLRSSYLLNCYDNSIKRFALTHNGEVCYDLARGVKENELWTLNAPQTDVAIDAVTVNTILTNMVRVQSEKFECFTKDKSELSKYGLDDPAYTFTVETDSKTMTFEFPEKGSDDESVWCYDTETGAVSSLSANGAAFLSGSWYDLITQQAMSVPFMNVSSLEIMVDGTKHTLSIDHEAETYHFDDIDVTAKDSEQAGQDFEYLYASVSEIKHGDLREDVPESMGEPTCTFRYTLTDGSERELALVPTGEGSETYWAYIDGRCFGMTVERSAITSSNGCLSFIERLTEDLKNADAAAE
ncbi:MAG: DUF4340 domain-containing protein [Ruminococcus sp.]|nr:DUF4340 domain-containing protein [Ruminococcus sp.]